MVVYGLPIGLLLAGYGIEHVGYPMTASIYVVGALFATGFIGWRYLWRP
jgi:hypothetical protein